MTTYISKSIAQLQQEYFQALANSGSELRFDSSQGSIINALSRGSAAVAAQQDLALKELTENLPLPTATGDYLDSFASFGLQRIAASASVGYVLAISPTDILVAPQTLLTDPQTGLQLVTTNTTNVTVTYLETLLPVRSLLASSQANLVAGTKLYSPTYPTVSWVVGTQHLPNNTYEGSLSGGADLETDGVFRQRLINWLTSHTTASKTSLKAKLLTFPGVSRSFTYTNTPGVLEVWVDTPNITFNEGQRSELIRFIKPYIADGILVTVAQVTTIPIDLEFLLVPNSKGSSVDQLMSRVRQLCVSYFQRFEVGQAFVAQDLINIIKPLVLRCELKSPAFNKLAKVGQLFVVGDIEIRYPA